MAKSDKGKPVDSGVGVLEFRIGSCLSSPTKRMVADLEDIALQCRRIRNTAIRWIIRYWEDNPTILPAGKNLISNEAMVLLSKYVISKYPNIGSALTYYCIREVISNLAARMPYTHKGKASRRWKAIMDCETNVTSFDRSDTIPLHNQTIRLCYDGVMEGSLNGPVAKEVFACGKNSSVVACQVFSRKSGRKPNLIFRVETRQKSYGDRIILKRVARGEWKLRDSIIFYKEGKGKGRSKLKGINKTTGKKKRRKRRRPKEDFKYNGAWFFQMRYVQPRVKLGLDVNRTAEINLLPGNSDRPFEIRIEEAIWKLGAAKGLMYDINNYKARRLAMRRHSQRGHGRQRIERDIRKVTRRVRDLMDNFTKDLINEIVKFCKRFDCGKIKFTMPSKRQKANSWFETNNIDFFWTGFESRLRQKMHHYYIEMVEDEKKPKKVRVKAAV